MLNRKNLLLSSLVSIALLSASSVQARYENDVRLGTLLESAIPEFVYPKDYQGDKVQPPELETEVEIYFQEGYHPVTVLFYAMRNGMSADEVIDIAGKAGLAREHLADAVSSLEPVLPGGVCGTSYFIKDPTAIPGSYSLTSLKQELEEAANDGSGGGHEEPMLADLVDKYFNDEDVVSINQDNPNLHQVHNSDWTETTSQIPPTGVPDNVKDFLEAKIPAHMHASAEELLALVEQSNDYWYFVDSPIQQGKINSESLDTNAPILISMYTDEQQVVVSPSQIKRIQQAQLNGDRLAVMFFFSSANVRPLSQISKRIGFAELANAYIRNGIKVSALPSWEDGNFHTLATAQQLKDLFDLPAKEDIPEERYAKALSTIDNGRPLQVAFVGGKMFLGNPDRAVAMIEDGGYDLLPLNISYVDLEPDENMFSICENAFPFAAGSLGGIGSNTPSGVVVIPDPPECVPTTKIVKVPRIIVKESPTRKITVIDRKTITIPCPPKS